MVLNRFVLLFDHHHCPATSRTLFICKIETLSPLKCLLPNPLPQPLSPTILLFKNVMILMTLLLLLLSRFSRVRLCATPWTVAHQAPLSMGFPRQECWSELPFPHPGRGSSQHRDQTQNSSISCIAGRLFTTEPPGKPTATITVTFYHS